MNKEQLKLWMEQDAYEDFIGLLPESISSDDPRLFEKAVEEAMEGPQGKMIREYCKQLDKVTNLRIEMRMNNKVSELWVGVGLAIFLVIGMIYFIKDLAHDSYFYFFTAVGLILCTIGLVKEWLLSKKIDRIKVGKITMIADCFRTCSECIPPFINVTGAELLEALKIDGKLTRAGKFDFTNMQIYEALKRCEHVLGIRDYSYKDRTHDISLSERQASCAEAVTDLIMMNRYNDALHEFEDCIDDYSKGFNRTISANEYALYRCILKCFIKRLEEQEDNL